MWADVPPTGTGSTVLRNGVSRRREGCGGSGGQTQLVGAGPTDDQRATARRAEGDRISEDMNDRRRFNASQIISGCNAACAKGGRSMKEALDLILTLLLMALGFMYFSWPILKSLWGMLWSVVA